MLNFSKKIILFLLPLILIFIFPVLVFRLGREDYSINQVVESQVLNKETLFGLAYNYLDKPYKEQLLSSRNPEVIVLGASRVFQFRQEFFKTNNFVNAGGIGSGVEAIEEFTKNLSVNNQTKIIMVGFDPRDLTDNNVVSTTSNIKYKWLAEVKKNKVYFENLLGVGWRRVYADYFSGKFSLRKLWEKHQQTKHIGLNALINQDGFRFDGSYQYAKKLSNLDRRSLLELEIKDELKAIKRDINTFEYGFKVSDQALASLSEDLKRCRERGIEIIGFLPPRPKVVYEKMTSDDYINQSTVKELPLELQRVFSEHSYSFYDFSDIEKINGNDQEFLDPSHGTDKMMLRVTIYLSEKNKLLRQFVDVDKLKNKLEKSKKDFLDI